MVTVTVKKRKIYCILIFGKRRTKVLKNEDKNYNILFLNLSLVENNTKDKSKTRKTFHKDYIWVTNGQNPLL